MNVAFLLWRARLRRSGRAVLALSLLFAIGGGVALAVGAGARRTGDADAEVRRTANALDIGTGYGPHDPHEIERTLAQHSEIEAAELNIGFEGQVPSVPPGSLLYYIAIWHEPALVDRTIVLTGRNPTSGNEVFLNEAAADGTGLKIGDHLTFLVANKTYDDFRPVDLAVVGIGLIPDEVVEDESAAKPAALMHRDFAVANIDRISWGNAQIRFRPGTDRARVLEQLAQQGLFPDETAAEDRRRVEDAMRPLVITLAVLCLLAGLAIVLVVGQAVSRICRRSESDERTLLAAGCARRQLVGADMLTAITVAMFGTAGAVGLAIAGSPVFPIGRSARIKPLRGFDIDEAALAVGGLVLATLLVLVVTAITWRRSVSTKRRPRAGAAPAWLGTNAARSTGVRFASGRRGTAGTIGGVVVGLATLVAAVMFTGSVSNLLEKPALSGFNWDVMARTSFSPIDGESLASAVAANRDIVRATGVGFAGASVRGDRVPVGIWKPLRGSPWPPLLRGRHPEADNEVLIGQATLDRHGFSVGDRIEARVEYLSFSGETSLIRFDVTIVGVAVSPAISLAGSDTPRLDEGLLMRFEDFRRLAGDGLAKELIFVVMFNVGDDARDDPLEVIRSQFPDGLPNRAQVPTEWFTSAQPAELSQAGSARTTIGFAIVALLFAVVGVNVHSLLGFVRQRGRAYAVLKALGFTPQQVRASVFWQSLIVVVIGFALAVPLGIAGGRLLGRAFADAIGVISPTALPLVLVASAVIGAFVVLQLAAALPAGHASRTTASRDLRAE